MLFKKTILNLIGDIADPTIWVKLSDGFVYRGNLISIGDDHIYINDKVLGRIIISNDSIVRLRVI